MKRDSLLSMIEQVPGAQRQADSFVLDQSVDVTVFAQAGGDLVTVARVERLDLRPEYVALHGSKGEKVFFPYEHIAGLKVEPRGAPGASGATSRTPPGFGAR